MQENCGGRGRGAIAARPFKKGEILVDYHAKPISKAEGDLIMSAPESDRRSDYLFCIPSNGVYFDGSEENCTCHPQTRLLGRLLNFAASESSLCNTTAQYFEFPGYDKKTFKTVLFIAKRDINPLEELMFDYGDENCKEMFK